MTHGPRAGPVADLLHGIGLRATGQRVALVSLLFGAGDRHVTAEGLFREARAAGIGVVRATVYNTLHALTEHGLLRAIVVDAERTYFDTNTGHGCHLYREETGELVNLDDHAPAIQALLAEVGAAPGGADVLIRVRPVAKAPAP